MSFTYFQCDCLTTFCVTLLCFLYFAQSSSLLVCFACWNSLVFFLVSRLSFRVSHGRLCLLDVCLLGTLVFSALFIPSFRSVHFSSRDCVLLIMVDPILAISSLMFSQLAFLNKYIFFL
jgi:hypothetical protein